LRPPKPSIPRCKARLLQSSRRLRLSPGSIATPQGSASRHDCRRQTLTGRNQHLRLALDQKSHRPHVPHPPHQPRRTPLPRRTNRRLPPATFVEPLSFLLLSFLLLSFLLSFPQGICVCSHSRRESAFVVIPAGNLCPSCCCPSCCCPSCSHSRRESAFVVIPEGHLRPSCCCPSCSHSRR